MHVTTDKGTKQNINGFELIKSVVRTTALRKTVAAYNG